MSGTRPPLALIITINLITITAALGAQALGSPGSGPPSPLFLADMTWPELERYLKSCDMILVPIGSTEQHGPHLPLGTDAFEAQAMSAEISRRTGVMVAPILALGISGYHMGFPGTISLSEETMERVLMEEVDSLRAHGFRRFLFFNYHGGNRIVQDKVIHYINHHTPATAIALGIGSPIMKEIPLDFFDWHAGIEETSTMLYLRPEMVHLDQAKKPVITFTPQMEKLRQAGSKESSLMAVWQSQFTTDVSTGKGGSSRELSDNGVWCMDDPAKSTASYGKNCVDQMIEEAVTFILAWKEMK